MSASTHPNTDLARRATEAYSTGDLEGLVGLFADDAVWHGPGNNRASGSFRGRDAILGWFGGMKNAMGTLVPRVELLDGVADDNFLFFFVNVTLEQDGSQTPMKLANAWRFADGKVVESWFLPEDTEAWDAFVGSQAS